MDLVYSFLLLLIRSEKWEQAREEKGPEKADGEESCSLRPKELASSFFFRLLGDLRF